MRATFSGDVFIGRLAEHYKIVMFGKINFWRTEDGFQELLGTHSLIAAAHSGASVESSTHGEKK